MSIWFVVVSISKALKIQGDLELENLIVNDDYYELFMFIEE